MGLQSRYFDIHIVTECSALAESKKGKEGEPFNVKSEPQPATYSSRGADGIAGYLGVRPDDCPRSICRDYRCLKLRNLGSLSG